MLYNTSRLVTEVKKNNLFLIKLLYNNRGHRIKKEINNQSTGSLIKSEYYVRDASGGVLAIYKAAQLVNTLFSEIVDWGFIFVQAIPVRTSLQTI